jgi:hypothetical protein
VTEASADAPSVLHPIQLVDVHCATVRAEHRAKDPEAKPDSAGVSLGLTPLDDTRRTFGARLDVKISGPSPNEDEIAELAVVVQGTFTSDADIPDEMYARYTEFTPVALLWPYARAYLAQLASMLGAAIPPLPSLDVLGLGRANEEPTTEA